VRLVPARHPPHKAGLSIAPAERRAAWLEASVADRPGLVVDRRELGRDGPSYTADTLEAMAAEAPGALDLWFILGADQLEGFPTWSGPERILAVARLAVAARRGAAETGPRQLADRVAPGRADILAMPEIDISSSLIRARMAAGQPVGHLVPLAVEAALRREGLVPSRPYRSERKDPTRPPSS
jgi:nicotinate-nucleotide adenylyltransferase